MRLTDEDFIEEYTERYQIIKHQKETARRERTPSLEKYRASAKFYAGWLYQEFKGYIEQG